MKFQDTKDDIQPSAKGEPPEAENGPICIAPKTTTTTLLRNKCNYRVKTLNTENRKTEEGAKDTNTGEKVLGSGRNHLWC